MTQALQNGAAPYLSEEDRVAFGVTRGSAGALVGNHDHGAGGLKFQAYEKAAPPVPKASGEPFAGD